MSNSKRGEIAFKAGGESYTYKMSTNAMCAFQDETGTSIMTALQGLEGGADVDLRQIRALFWAGIRTDVTIDEAGDLLDDLGYERAMEVVTEGVQAAFPQDEKSAGNGKGKPKAAA